MPRVLLALVLAGLLAGCHPREQVDFASDPRILRGHWEGRLEHRPEPSQEAHVTELTLDLEASYLDSGHYAFSGTIRFGEGSPQAISGTASGGQMEVYLQSTIVPPLVPPGFEARIPAANLHLCAYGGDIETYYGVAFETYRPRPCPLRPYGRDLAPFDYHFTIRRAH